MVTREQALNYLRSSGFSEEQINTVVEALTEPKQGETVSLEAFKQVLWEREIAEQQLHELGYGLGEKIEPKQEWISVEDRLPEKLKDVVVTFYDAPDEYDIAYMRKTFNKTYIAYGAENEWVSSMGETDYADYEITAWMPIPPYKGDKEDNALQRD